MGELDMWALRVGETARMLRPERHFDTIACRAALHDDLVGGIAELAGGRACRIVTVETARRLVGGLASEGPVSGGTEPPAGVTVARPLAMGTHDTCGVWERTSRCVPVRPDSNEREVPAPDAAQLRLHATPLRQLAPKLREVGANGARTGEWGEDEVHAGVGAVPAGTTCTGELGADAGGALLVADDTLANPWLCRPLSMGFDVAAEDLRPWLGMDACAIVAGSDELLARALACAGARVGEPCEVARDACVRAGIEGEGPTAWERALDQLVMTSASVQRRCDTALAVAHYLSMHPAVAWVSYPGLPDDPANDAARRVLEHGFGACLTFGLAGGREAVASLSGAADDGAATLCGAPTTPKAFPSVLGVLGEGDALLLRAGLETPLDVVQALEELLAPARQSNPRDPCAAHG